ncbi:MAG: HD domain-containing protein [Candidatus Gracilibacteria bacterium]
MATKNGETIVFKNPFLKKSISFAYNAHKDQKRHSGEDYINHPIEVAKILSKFNRDDEEMIAAGLLHDVIEKSQISLDQIENEFGESIKDMVDGVTKLAKIHYESNPEMRQTEALKKMFFIMSKDVRVILVKLADRLHNMRTIEFMPKDERKRSIATETLEIYCPIANILGLRQWAWELENLSFKVLNPRDYEEIKNKYRDVLKNLSGHTSQLKKGLSKFFHNKISLKIVSFKKHEYHIYRAIKQKKNNFDPVSDSSAIKVITNSVDNCYKVLGAIHRIYPPKPYAVKDYIAVPKINGYRGLHTTVFDTKGDSIHIQILTEEMDKYSMIMDKEKVYSGNLIKSIIAIHERTNNPLDFINQLKLDVLSDKIFVFSGQGEIFDLPEKSTCVDFAYAISEEEGHQCSGAIINGIKTHPLATLKNGDIVKIIVSKSQKGPLLDWIEFVKTDRARHHISNWFDSDKESNIRRGEDKMDLLFQKIINTTFKKEKHRIAKIIQDKCLYENMEDMLNKVGSGRERPCAALSKLYSDDEISDSMVKNHYPQSKNHKTVKIIIEADDVVGILNKITQIMASRGINIEDVRTMSRKATKTITDEFIIDVENGNQLCELIFDLERIAGVRKVYKI